MSRVGVLLGVLGIAALMISCAGETPPPNPSGADGYIPPPPSPSPTPPMLDGGYQPPVMDGYVPPVTYDSGTLPPPAGSASCTDIFACFFISQCQANDTNCGNTCIAKGTATAQQQFQAVQQCESSATSCTMCNQQLLDLNCANCLNASCQPQFTACGMTQTCEQGYICMDSCGQNDIQCFETCISKLTIVGLAQYEAAEICWDTATKGFCAASCTNTQSQQCYACTDVQCAAEFTACGII